MKGEAMSRALLAIAVGAVLTGCQSRQDVSYQVREWPLENLSGHIVETEHYLIYTTVSDSMFDRGCAELAEAQYRRFAKDVAVHPEGKMKVYVFANRGQWEAYTQVAMGPRAKDYLRIRDGGYSANETSVLYYLRRYPTLAVLAHELFHQYLDCAGDEPVPAWLNEGMACYYEAHEWNGTKPVFTPKNNTFRRETLGEAYQTEQLYPLTEILATHAGEVSKGSSMKVGTYYAQVWALVLFLRDGAGGKYAEGFKLLLAEMGTGALKTRVNAYAAASAGQRMSFGEVVFRQYITEDFETFEAEFGQFVKDLLGWEKKGMGALVSQLWPW